jgi:hypothetical protein
MSRKEPKTRTGSARAAVTTGGSMAVVLLKNLRNGRGYLVPDEWEKWLECLPSKSRVPFALARCHRRSL